MWRDGDNGVEHSHQHRDHSDPETQVLQQDLVTNETLVYADVDAESQEDVGQANINAIGSWRRKVRLPYVYLLLTDD